MLKLVPDSIKKVLSVCAAAGFDAYIVGGAVRDLLLGRQPHDYDVATSATPVETVRIAEQAGWQIAAGLGHNFGVVLVIVDGQPVEIATFRGESYGADSHRPANVWFAERLEADLARRDFTINAMALALDGRVIDLFGGQRDLAAGIIRTVGEPHKRFQEDALRMLRACRFAAQLGFTVDAGILSAIKANVTRTAGLSVERVRCELEKMLLAPWPAQGLDVLVKTGLAAAECRMRQNKHEQAVPILPELMHLVSLPQNPAYHRFDAWQHTLEAVAAIPADSILRWAALLHDVAKGLPGIRGQDDNGQPTDHGHDQQGAKLAAAVLARLQLPPRRRQRVAWLVSRHMRYYTYCGASLRSLIGWVRQEARSGYFHSSSELKEAFGQLAQLCAADAAASSGATHTLTALGACLTSIAASMPVTSKDLNYRAAELLAVLGKPEFMREFLRICLQRVQDGTLLNDSAAITAAAGKWIKRKKAAL